MSDLLEVEVAFLSFDTKANLPIIFLREKEPEEDESNRLLPIWIGVTEASAIYMKISGESPKRPMTHDLMSNILNELNVKVVSVEVVSIEEHTFYGQINLKKGNRKYSIDSRPSDAIALALRTESPIFVAEEVMADSGLLEETLEEMGKEFLKSELANMNEEDIDKYKV
jgi:bifunctional DNase/RNase